jgi:hypothetical protein
VYNAEFVERIAREERWIDLEEYLKQYYISRFGSTARLHPQLLLYCRRAWLIRLLRAGSGTDASRFYIVLLDLSDAFILRLPIVFFFSRNRLPIVIISYHRLILFGQA